MKNYPHSNDYLPGTWKGVVSNGPRKAFFSCPTCGRLGSLIDHEIADDGTVTPSVVCSYDCGFHEYIVLKDWNEVKE